MGRLVIGPGLNIGGIGIAKFLFACMALERMRIREGK